MLLENIKSPKDVKQLSPEQLRQLAEEIRAQLIDTVSHNGGHLASNLGVVELTIGLHYVFDSPKDSLLFDVGHQCYVHKLLTGRYDRFSTIRKQGGLSGFMNPDESEHDPVISGHSSAALSAACGIAEAKRLLQDPHYTIAVVGDGAFTGGMTFEALNNSGQGNDHLIVILNDNKMSISENVGSLAHHLAKIRIGERYISFKRHLNSFNSHIPVIGNAMTRMASKIKTVIKNALYSSNYFESMGYYYMGPIDGNSIDDVVRTLRAAQSVKKPVLIHAFTVKGKGFPFAEQSPTSYHGVSQFDSEVGVSLCGDSFSSEFGQAMCDLARQDDSVLAVTAAMAEGTGLSEFRDRFPDRFYDVGIAEEHAVTYCCGLSKKGFHPVFAVYSSFLQRGYDQLIHDAALGKANLTLAIDRAGIVGEDGATHQGLFDVPFLNTIPHVRIHCPAYYEELQAMLADSIQQPGVSVVRYPRGKQPERPSWYRYEGETFTLRVTDSSRIAVTYGRLFGNLWQACEKTGVSIAKINCVKPFPDELVEKLLSFDTIWFYEEGNRSGGVGEKLACALMERHYHGNYRLIAVEEGFVEHMPVESAFCRFGFDVPSMVNVMSEE